MFSKIRKYFNYTFWSNLITDSIISSVPQAQFESREKIEYGAYMTLSEFTKITIVLAAAVILHMFWHVVGIILLFGLLRWNLGGIHAKTHWACMVSYSAFIYGILTTSIWLQVDRLILAVAIVPFAIVVTYLYAPADMPSKPIVSKKQRRRLRITGFILLVILTVLSFLLPQTWFNIIMLTIALTAVLMTPPIYKLTKNQYGKEAIT